MRPRETRGCRRTPELPQGSFCRGVIRESTLPHENMSRRGRAPSAVASRPGMRVETREPSGSDVRAAIDSDLTAGDVRRTDDELRVGPPAQLDADGRRTAAAWAARALRAEGGTIAWRAEDEEQVRAIVEGTAFGAYEPGLFKDGYANRPELTLALD